MPKIPITARRTVTAMGEEFRVHRFSLRLGLRDCFVPQIASFPRNFDFGLRIETRVIPRLVGYLGGLTPSRSECETAPSYRLRTPM